MLNLVFLLDITGSMGNELEGVTKTVSELVKTVYADDALSVMVTIVTFTESASGCYVTNHSFTDGAKASAFVSSIKLCSPPGSPHITNANGGDGDENHKAALAELLLLDNAMPTIAFLISDAGPHLIADRLTPEAGHELQHLKRKHNIVYADMFHILGLVQTHFGNNLILNVIKYIKNSDHALYGAIAKQFNGVLITPQERRADKLAKGLMAILTTMFQSFSSDTARVGSDGYGGYALDERALSAFAFYDVHDIVLPASEAEVKKDKQPEVGSTKKALFELIERATVIVGNKFAKRAIEATGLQEQVELLLVIAKCLTKTMPFNTALDRATALVTTIREAMPEESQGHFKIQECDLPLLLSQELEPTLEVEAAVSAITLMGPAETALTSLGISGDAEERAAFEPEALIQTAAGLFLGHLAVLRLPEKNGKLDFMDSWSAVIVKMSNDIMSAADFLKIIGSDDAAAGLSIRANEYNYAQMFADPRDKVGSTLLQVASGTQVLDIITALLAGAPPGLFSPNMFRGTIAASLMALVLQHEPPLTSYQRDIARKLVHTIRLVMGPKLKALKVDPEQPASKLLFRLLRLEASGEDEDEKKRVAVRGFLQEMLAARIQNVLKWNPSAFLESVEHMVAYEHVSAIEDVFKPHALDANMWIFDAAQACERIATRKIAQAFRVCAENALQVAYGHTGGNDDKGDKKSMAPLTLEDVWPTFSEDLPKYMLLHKRTARYAMKKDGASLPASEIVWEDNFEVNKRLDDDSFAVLAMQLLRKKHDGFLRALRASRLDATAQQHWQAAIETMRAPLSDFVGRIEGFATSACLEHKLLLKAFKTFGPVLDTAEYEAKLQVLITGRRIHKVTGVERVVFNRGNLHPHPDCFVPMRDAFKAKLRALQRERKWPLSHTYRPTGVPNHSGFSNSNPSEWAARRSNAAQTFWEEE
ncbi:hypothetical protein Gpo141_00004855 [Globisporangium polare]